MSADFRGGCWACGRTDVRKRPARGKQYHRHNCPHGVACTSGGPQGREGMNGPARGGPHYCPECVAAWGAYWRGRNAQ